MSRLRSFASLSVERRRLFLFTLGVLAVARVGLSLTSFRRTAHALGQLPVASGRSPPREDIRWAVETAGNQVPGATCLVRGVTAHSLCRRYGYPSRLCVGVDRTGDELLAHSWVEIDGDVLVGDDVDLDRFERLGVVTPS